MKKEISAMMDMMLRPAFCVSGSTVQLCNAAAHALLLEEGTPIDSLLLTGQEDLAALESGCLYLQLSLSGSTWGAAVTRLEDTCLFVLDQDGGELGALALAAKELRSPLNNLLAISGSLLPSAFPDDDPKVNDLLARMSRELYRLQRILGNMADAPHAGEWNHQAVHNIAQVFDDIFEKAAAYLSFSGVTLAYQGLRQDVFGLIDVDQMERAVLNILSNAAKFGTELRAGLTRHGSTLRLSIQDNGPGIGEDILGTLFQRYLRQPGIEDSRHGLGLGMVLIRSAAASHGGTVLVDSPQGCGTRVTLTLRLRLEGPAKVQSPLQSLSGGRDQALIELSQILPPSVYEKEL